MMVRNASAVAFIGLSGVLALAGLLLLASVLLGRRNRSRPACRACRFDLRACDYLSGVPSVCPACGKQLKRVRFGQEGFAWKPAVTAALLLTIPLWALPLCLREPVAASPTLVSTAELLERLRSQASPDGTMGQLLKRVNELTRDQVIEVLQAHSRRTYPAYDMPEFLAATHARFDLPRDLVAAVARQAAWLMPRAPKVRVRSQDLIEVSLLDYQNLLPSQHLWSAVSLRQIIAGDKMVLYDRSLTKEPDDEPGFLYSDVPLKLAKPLPRGTHELRFIIDLGVTEAHPPMLGVGGSRGVPEKWYKPLATWTEEPTVSVTVP